MSISLADLQLLVDVAELGSFSQAAARRGWSQPQVSQRVALLEETLGNILFQRHRRGATPTAACLAFLGPARQSLEAFAQAQEAMQATPALPRLHLSCLPSLASPVFGLVLTRLAEAPIEIRCHTDHSQQIMQELLTGQVDVGFVLKCPPMSGIQMELLWRSPIVPVVAAGHPLAEAGGALRLAEVAEYRIAPQYWGDGCEELIRQIRLSRPQHSAIHAIQPASAARELVLRHGFVSFMPELSIRSDLRDGTLVRLEVGELPLWQWEVMMAYRAGKRMDPAKGIVLDAARALAGECQQG
ncbi:LysR family transcriptional regulator [uncultured Aquitalea sp.]|uniref:LysR family transcriptional regulator n=1 Tax=uncultured Aquitalea sp. TaxID=540272 RepID=UPI0025D12246|nr:LysR family transcriptional regulator [uncultured Aquitalea sp.]